MTPDVQRHFDFEEKKQLQHSSKNYENERLNLNFDKTKYYFDFAKPSFNTATTFNLERSQTKKP
jgi:hypothetical protein